MLLELAKLLFAPAFPDAPAYGKDQFEPALFIPQMWNHFGPAPLRFKRPRRQMRGPHLLLMTGRDLEMVQTRRPIGA